LIEMGGETKEESDAKARKLVADLRRHGALDAGSTTIRRKRPRLEIRESALEPPRTCPASR